MNTTQSISIWPIRLSSLFCNSPGMAFFISSEKALNSGIGILGQPHLSVFAAVWRGTCHPLVPLPPAVIDPFFACVVSSEFSCVHQIPHPQLYTQSTELVIVLHGNIFSGVLTSLNMYVVELLHLLAPVLTLPCLQWLYPLVRSICKGRQSSCQAYHLHDWPQ